VLEGIDETQQAQFDRLNTMKIEYETVSQRVNALQVELRDMNLEISRELHKVKVLASSIFITVTIVHLFFLFLTDCCKRY
jgi:hypothetical protein